MRIRALVNIAIYYQQTDQYEQSLSTYIKASELAGSLPQDSYLKLLVEVNLGNIYIAIADYEMATKTMKNVIRLAKNQDNPDQFLSVAYSILGTAALRKKEYQAALEYMEQTKALSIKMDRNDNVIRTMINISECYLELQRYHDVIDNSTQALKRITSEESVESKALTQITIGAAYIGLEKPKEALAPLQEAQEIAISGNFLKIKMDSHEHLALVYESLGDLKKSLEEQKAYTNTREAYLKTLSKAQRLEVEKESKNKSDIITKQQKSIVFLSKEKQLYIFLGVILVILLIVSSVIYLNKRKRLAKESLQLQDDKALLKNENEALKDKLNELAKRNQKDKESSGGYAKSQSHKKPSLNQQDQEKYMKLILEYMEIEKPYLNHEIKQSDIPGNLDMTVHLFSEVLNVCFKKNFNNFINLYRVDSAKQLMKDPIYKNYKILAIGYEAGFPSKTSFNRVFKNLVGLTPTEYQKKHMTSSGYSNE